MKTREVRDPHFPWETLENWGLPKLFSCEIQMAGLGCFQEGQEATPNPVFWIHLRQFLFRSFKVFTGDLKQTL